ARPRRLHLSFTTTPCRWFNRNAAALYARRVGKSPRKMPTRVAILDDYQRVALSMADWSTLGPGVSVQPFHDRIGSEDALAERLRSFNVIVAMRERTPFPETLITRL